MQRANNKSPFCPLHFAFCYLPFAFLNNMEKPLVDNDYVVEKMLGKGGWSYVVISGIPPEKKARLGLVGCADLLIHTNLNSSI